ncbi:hypothetical protein EYF80_042869 [Liparis tanakae]|uniref:Uncharacterized protein n=1 Tax=Liparis tanakae TaxID=230148 RepID=A0A4Z2G0Y1_9TELE|nr:hypothetical protein EYF80_042869 [Liparis tanakae]
MSGLQVLELEADGQAKRLQAYWVSGGVKTGRMNHILVTSLWKWVFVRILLAKLKPDERPRGEDGNDGRGDWNQENNKHGASRGPGVIYSDGRTQSDSESSSFSVRLIPILHNDFQLGFSVADTRDFKMSNALWMVLGTFYAMMGNS